MFLAPSAWRCSSSIPEAGQPPASRSRISVVRDDVLDRLFVIRQAAFELLVLHSREDFLKAWSGRKSKRNQIFTGDQRLWCDVLWSPSFIHGEGMVEFRKVFSGS